ncbi:MAG: PilZ domain-containing protein [Hyphomicrobium sp.]
MTVSDPSNDRRAFGRKATFQHAVVLIAGRSPVRCIVSDLSEGGAFLDFGGAVTLPARIQVRWEGQRAIANCEVRHAEATGIGVQFTCPVGPQIACEAKAAAQQPAPSLSEPQGEPPLAAPDEVTNAPEPAHVKAMTPPPLPTWFVAPDTAAGLVHAMRTQRANRPPPPTEAEKLDDPPKMFGWLQR